MMLDSMPEITRQREVLKSYGITRMIRVIELIILLHCYYNNRDII